MSSKGHCCLCQFTAINNDIEVLIKHLSYCHPRFVASSKVHFEKNYLFEKHFLSDGSLFLDLTLED
jgi:hypothetical protein